MALLFEKQDSALSFLSGGGEMGEQIRNFDWSATSIGPPANWPQSLKTCVRIILTSSQPMFVWWGKEEKINIYNEPYRYILGNKHPQALGRSGYETWKEILEWIGPRVEHVLNKNEGTYDEALMLIMNRYGYDEETFFKFSYNPVPGDDGTTQGLFCACTEETQHIIYERQLVTLRALAKVLGPLKSLESVREKAIEVVGQNGEDFPAAFIYTDKFENLSDRLIADIEQQQSNSIHSPDTVTDMRAIDNAAIIAKSTQKIQVVKLTNAIGYPENNKSGKKHDKLIIAPVLLNDTNETAALLVVVKNPYRPIDDKYLDFFRLVTEQIAASIMNVRAFEKEEKSKEALKESEELFRTMAEGTEVLITVADDHGKTNYFNSGWTKITGRATEDLIKNGLDGPGTSIGS